MPNDFRKPMPTQNERRILELTREFLALRKYAEATNQLLHSLLAVMDSGNTIDLPEIVKTFSNDIRQQNIRMKIMAEEMKQQKEKELILPK